MRQFFTGLVFTLVISDALRANEEDVITTNAVGVGASEQAAEKNALANAVQQAVGLYLESETLIKNEKLIYDSVLSLSDRSVTRYDVLIPMHTLVERRTGYLLLGKRMSLALISQM